MNAVAGATGPARDGSGRPRLIITADDFGRDPVGTAAIAENLANGNITAASLMANGARFEDACARVHALGLHGKIGVHIALDEGPPLSAAMRPFTDANGQLAVSRRFRPLSRRLSQAIEAECAAQVSRVIQAGIVPTHLDSHRHIHTVFPIGRLVIGVALALGIPYVRPARNLTRTAGRLSRAYKYLFNQYVAARVATADFFGDIEDFVEQRYAIRAGSLVELMIHVDGSDRGLRGQRLLASAAIGQLRTRFELVGHPARSAAQ